MITEEHTKEALCRAYVQAIAGRAGVNASISDREFDYGIDGTFNEVQVRTLSNGKKRHVESGFKWDFQLKCTVKWEIEGTDILYDLEAKTHNDLAIRASTVGTTAAVLLVLCLPPEVDEWMALDEEQLILRKCGYWFRITGAPTTTTTPVAIRIPRTQIFSAEALRQLFTTLRQEAIQ
ncbi:MAG TPA: DUF4365 domain-containing protein [Candidatus Saccharimonadales bacterium]|nr:DUF4365 domain-containing protein [Candidatus Saccharimonadales bacterium]